MMHAKMLLLLLTVAVIQMSQVSAQTKIPLLEETAKELKAGLTR